MDITFNRDFSLIASVTPADELASGSYQLSVVHRVEPTANLALTGRVEFLTGASDAVLGVDLEYWVGASILGASGTGAGRTYHGFTGYDVDGVALAGRNSSARELVVQSYELADFVNYAQNYNVYYNPVNVYFVSSGGGVMGQQMLYPGDQLSFSSLAGPTTLNGGNSLANAQYLYMASLGPIHPYYTPRVEIMHLRRE